MNYINDFVRRQDRLLHEVDALELLKNGEYGFLSMVSTNGGGYGIPISYVWDNSNSIYFHCAPEGDKLNSLVVNNKVSFCVVGNISLIPNRFTTLYESIIIKGSVCITIPKDEQMRALMLIIDKYSPQFKETGMKYTEKSFHRTSIIRLDIDTISGKCKR